MDKGFPVTPLSEWLPGHKHPLIVAGPCSAESEEQVLATARALQKIPQVRIFRAGIWKPRTKPNGFEGVGSVGLKWLRKVKAETGLLTAVEVATVGHVQECLENGVDILWVGARTTVNPFYVQDIADALKGKDIPVFVKNPINPDLHLWIGALQRLSQAGIRKLVAIHRGFSSYEKSHLRNAPNWQIPVELERLMPGLPVICDPSHICGKADLIPSISQKALDLDMAGLMIETHINPKVALSDAEQQLTPEQLGLLLQNITLRKTSSSDGQFEIELESLRGQIDRIDQELLETLGHRMKVVQKIGECKRRNNVTALQMNRWNQVLEDRARRGKSLGLDEPFVNGIFQVLHDESLRMQTEMNSSKPIRE